MPVASEMFGWWNERRKDQPAGIDAAFFRLRTQIARDLRVCLEQPQYAAGDRAKQTHPDIEEYRRDLVTVVETAEHQPLGRQSKIPSRRAGVRHLTPYGASARECRQNDRMRQPAAPASGYDRRGRRNRRKPRSGHDRGIRTIRPSAAPWRVDENLRIDSQDECVPARRKADAETR